MQAMVAAYNEGKEVTVPGFDGTYATNLFVKNSKTKSGIVSAKCTDGLDIALDVVLTDALRKEGAVRDVIRQCQLLRKEAGYSVEQRITAAVATEDAFLLEALTEKQAHIAAELLADSVVINGAFTADLSKEFDVAGAKVTASVRK